MDAKPLLVFDADNHMYELPEALTEHLPREHRRDVQFVTVEGRSKLAVKGQIAEFIPNPTFEVVAAPGSHGAFYGANNDEGLSLRELAGEPIPCDPAFQRPEPRVARMDEQGVSQALMFPSIASMVEQPLVDDPELAATIVHALNEWMHETWSFNYQDRIYAAPVITPGIVERAVAELEWVLERGAKVILMRPAPAAGPSGSRSWGLPEFDPFWELVQDSRVIVAIHGSDTALGGYLRLWEGRDARYLPFQPKPFRGVVLGHRDIYDTIAALICHGALTRFPEVRIASVENGADWVPELLRQLRRSYRQMPHEYAEDPVETFQRAVYVNPFWEEDLDEIIDLVGADRMVFGSDYPHPEGLADPRSYLSLLERRSDDEIEKIMGGNLRALIGRSA